MSNIKDHTFNDAQSVGTQLALAEMFSHAAVDEAMQDAWNDICSDTGCHPLDIEHGKGKHLTFSPNHWANQVAKRLFVRAVKVQLKADASQPRAATVETDERCPTCSRTDYEEAHVRMRCRDPWHADDHLRARPRCSADNAESLRKQLEDTQGAIAKNVEIQEAPSLNREGREHPSYDNPLDPFASPDRLPEQSADSAREALRIAQDYLIEEANSGSVWSSRGNAKALAAINAVLTSDEPQTAVDREALERLIQRHASAYVARGAAISDAIVAECKASREALLAACSVTRPQHLHTTNQEK